MSTDPFDLTDEEYELAAKAIMDLAACYGYVWWDKPSREYVGNWLARIIPLDGFQAGKAVGQGISEGLKDPFSGIKARFRTRNAHVRRVHR